MLDQIINNGRTLLLALALAACAHVEQPRLTPPPVSSSSEGDVARTLVSAPAARQGATFRPIALEELVSARTFAPVVRSLAPAAPAEVWRGTYVGKTYGQRGAIALVLRNDGRTQGVVAWRVARSASNADEQVALVRVPVVATQRDSGQLVLTLDEFFDPACNCTTRATFRGALHGDTLSGRFQMSGAATVVGEERGRWRVVRVAP